MLPTLAPMLEMAARRRAKVPTFCSFRTRTVRIILRSHAMRVSFPSTYRSRRRPRRRPTGMLYKGRRLEQFHFLLYNFDHRNQLIEGFDLCAIDIREDSVRVVENGLKSGATRTDHICKIIVTHVDGLARAQFRASQCVFEDTRFGFI